MASVGLLPEAALQFHRCEDVRQGGVLCALPALLAIGLLRRVEPAFAWPKGYYPMEIFFIALAFLALARIRSLEALRYESPGEWGKLLGLDRIPEVKTLRQKIAVLCQESEPSTQWSSQLAQDWMAATTENPGYYYIDGHVRVYHGDAAHRPRAYVAREELCLRATLDYWVNAMDGQPFFVVTQDLNERLIESIQQRIIGRLIAEAPGQPSEEELAKEPLGHRFVIVFDREGYSPKFFKELLEQRIAVVTYAKRCKSTEDWPLDEFSQKTVHLINGQRVGLSVAERGTCLSNGLWVREVRHRDEGGHQTAILSTDFIRPLEKVLAGMFARWCQENYFRYMMEHFNLDRLVQYGAEPIPETSQVVNPARRALESQMRKERALLHRERAQLGAKHLMTGACASKIAAFEQEQGQLVEQIRCRERQLDELREQRKTVPKHVSLKELPEADRFTKLRSVSKHFVDTIKMIAYRAETGMVGVVRQKLKREEDARSLIRQIFESSVNLIPNEEQKTLTIQIHPLSTSAHNEVLKHLCDQLTGTETIYPKTDLRMIFEFLGPS
jgi:hypothetical protein